jgi:hypothetical protein
LFTGAVGIIANRHSRRHLLLVASLLKGAYDILLLIKFQKVRPPEEVGAPAG